MEHVFAELGLFPKDCKLDMQLGTTLLVQRQLLPSLFWITLRRFDRVRLNVEQGGHLTSRQGRSKARSQSARRSFSDWNESSVAERLSTVRRLISPWTNRAW